MNDDYWNIRIDQTDQEVLTELLLKELEYQMILPEKDRRNMDTLKNLLREIGGQYKYDKFMEWSRE